MCIGLPSFEAPSVAVFHNLLFNKLLVDSAVSPLQSDGLPGIEDFSVHSEFVIFIHSDAAELKIAFVLILEVELITDLILVDIIKLSDLVGLVLF